MSRGALDEETAQSNARNYEAIAYTDAATLTVQGLLDALYIWVPPTAHWDLEVQAAHKGIHLFVEKPVIP